MRDNDIVELILLTAKNQMNIADRREDEVLNVLLVLSEISTNTDSAMTTHKNAHPVTYDQAEAIYDQCSYG